jgi:hypothetical protein
MQKIFAFLVMLLCMTATAGAYTVILKNGRSMTGVLVSETADVIQFKDDAGIQYSLKKANLDLAKMAEVNAPKPEPVPPVMDTTAPENPKKKGRVYTREDVDALRDKYPELSIGDPIENPEDFEGGVLKPEAYATRLNEGATRINENLPGLVSLRDAAATAWEVASSTGKDPTEAVQAALATEEAATILKATSDDLVSLGRWQENMAGAPDQFKEGYSVFVQAITDLSDFQRGLREWNTFENVNIFRNRLSELENRLTASVNRLQSFQPAATETAPPPAETEEDETEPEPPLE